MSQKALLCAVCEEKQAEVVFYCLPLCKDCWKELDILEQEARNKGRAFKQYLKNVEPLGKKYEAIIPRL